MTIMQFCGFILRWVMTLMHAVKSFETEPSRIINPIPSLTRSSASSVVVGSWSDSTPAATHDCSSSPPNPAAWPSTVFRSSIVDLMLSRSGLLWKATPAAKASESPIASFQFSASFISLGPIKNPTVSSPSRTGPWEGTTQYIFNGVLEPTSNIFLMPFKPTTTPASCQSVITPVVPIGRTARAN